MLHGANMELHTDKMISLIFIVSQTRFTVHFGVYETPVIRDVNLCSSKRSFTDQGCLGNSKL